MKPIKMITAKPWILMITLFLVSACVSVPKEAVLLSEVVGERIAAMQVSHEMILHSYFDKSRNEIHHFIDDRWTPEFLESFVQESGVMDMLKNPEVLSMEAEDRIVEEILNREDFSEDEMDAVIEGVNSGMGDIERGNIMIEFAEAAQEQINLQRREMITQIDEVEYEMLRELKASYADLYQMQSTVTGHIRSVQKTVEARDDILARTNLLKTRDDVMNKALDFNEHVMHIVKKSGKASDLVDEIKTAVKE